MHRFYAPDIEKELRLPEEEARHCCRVLRLRDGERIEAVDGRGNLYLCEIKGAGSDKECAVEILEKTIGDAG